MYIISILIYTHTYLYNTCEYYIKMYTCMQGMLGKKPNYC